MELLEIVPKATKNLQSKISYTDHNTTTTTDYHNDFPDWVTHTARLRT